MVPKNNEDSTEHRKMKRTIITKTIERICVFLSATFIILHHRRGRPNFLSSTLSLVLQDQLLLQHRHIFSSRAFTVSPSSSSSSPCSLYFRCATVDNHDFLKKTTTSSKTKMIRSNGCNENDIDNDNVDFIIMDDDDDFVMMEKQLRNNNPEKRMWMERNSRRTFNTDINSNLNNSSNGDNDDDDVDNADQTLPDDTMLSNEQKKALNYIRDGRNVFITGVAGTGKSLVLKKALEHIKSKNTSKEYVAVAPTGSTAIALEGQTMHSFAGIGIPKVYTDFVKTKSNEKTTQRWMALKVLILDEVSMVSGEFFDSLSRIVSAIRKDPRPFGGIQLIVCGDFLQLPPIAPRRGEVEQMMVAVQEREDLDSPNDAKDWLFLNRGFCFQSLAWRESKFKVVELHHVYRQSNKDFVRILQNIRTGNVNDDTVRYLKDKCERPLPRNKFGIRPTVLHSKNVDVTSENLIDLNNLSGTTVTYTAMDHVEIEKGSGGGPWMKQKLEKSSFFSSCLAEKELQLKIGAQVMLIKNMNHNSRLANGSRGKVIGFQSVKKSGAPLNINDSEAAKMSLLPGVSNYPIVQFKNGLQQVIVPQKFQSRILGLGTCTRTTVPLKLAWAITTHKAQGLTLDYVIADVGQVFAEAQLYVALSRASDDSGLEIRNFSKNRVKANPLALQFYQNPTKITYPYWWDADGSKPIIMTTTLTSTKTKKISTASLSKAGTSPNNIIENNDPPKRCEKRRQYTTTRENNNKFSFASEEIVDRNYLQQKTVVELKEMLRERGMRVSGKKADLIDRLMLSTTRK